MSVIKKWSSGSIGNPYPDHSDRGNSNTKGLSYDSSGNIIGPGIEAYIEEDEVLASSDNRPLKNLVENDIILDKNISDVASEVDHGIFKDRYNEFSLEILNEDFQSDPEIPASEFLTTPLRINSGSSIINGKVTRIGNQKVLYFLREDDSLIFPDYENNEDTVLIELKDDNYFGDYSVVYTTISEDLPSNFESYEIKIVNKSTIDNTIEDRITISKIYRDWEDIVPLKSDDKEAINETINFKNDINFGQESDGYWLQAPTEDGKEIPGTYVTDVQIKKDIEIKDKFLEKDKFTTNIITGEKEFEIVTDGIFFNDIQWSISEQAFDSSADIQDIFVDNEDGIYFILRSNNFKEIFYKSYVSLQLQPKSLRLVGDPDSVNTGIKKIKDYIFIYGTNGFIKAFNVNDNFQEAQIKILDGFSTNQEITSIYEWNDQIWIAGETSVWHSNEKISTVPTPVPTIEDQNPTQDYSIFFSDWTFTELDLNSIVKDQSNDPIIKKITTLERTRGNIIIDTAINDNIFNLVNNGSFESGVPGNIPTNWNVTDDLNPMNSTFQMTASTGNSNTDKWGNYKAVLTKYTSANKATVYQDYLVESNSRNRIFNFSTYIKSVSEQSSTIGIAEYNEYDQIISFSEEIWSIGTTEINTWIRPELAFRITTDDTKYLRYYINCENNTPLQIDGCQLEEIDNTGIEITDITCAPDINGSLESKYFNINSPLSNYYVWMNVDTDLNNQGDSIDPKLLETTPGSGVPLYPELTNKIGVPVKIDINEIDVEVANKTAEAINFLGDFSAYRIQNTIKVQVNTDIPGQVVDAETGTLGTEGFEINIAIQGLYQASQYVENYEYLFIGFEKQDHNRTDPPFAVIDITNPTGSNAIKYVHGKYGDIKKINTALHDNSNRMYVTDDKRVYSLTFLNNYNSYDRFTMVNIGQESNGLDVSTRMHKFETVAKFNDRILFGGTVDNRVIKTEYALDSQEHDIEFKNIEDGSEEFLDLMGETVFIHTNGTDHAKLEFIRTEHCYEYINSSGETELGYYKPSENYGFKIFVDGLEEASIIIKSPDVNNGPWTLEEIYEQIRIEYQGNKLNWLDPKGELSLVDSLDWVTPQSSSVKNDGFYSIGRQDITRHIRGNIHKIFIPEDQDDKFYIIRGKQIFQSKFDPNILKDENGNYPEELKITGTVLTEENLPKSLTNEDFGKIWHIQDKAYYQWYGDHWEEVDYYTKWKIYDEVTLTKYKHLDNIEKTFADSAMNKVWVSLPIDPGYKLLKGSIRLKTNNVAEVGFTEGEDYFVDYDNNMIIRSDTTNLLLNPEFSFADNVININNYNDKGLLSTFNDLPLDLSVQLGDVYYLIDEKIYYRCIVLPANAGSRENAWNKFNNDFVPIDWESHLIAGHDIRFKRINDVYDERNEVAEIIMSSENPGNEIGVVYQVKEIDYSQDTYTFSVDLKSYNYSKVIVRISECDTNNITSMGYDKINNVFTDLVFNSSELIYEIGDINDHDLREDYDKWHSVNLSHEITDSRTTRLRVEIYSFKSNQLRFDKAQLERNASPTPFIEGSRSSRVDPNMHVWLDYVQYREMDRGVDFSFSQDIRKITIHEQVESNEYFYFKYKYEKIFNSYNYGNSKPITAVNYDTRDDFYLLQPEGRIWAINQMFAMLSLETEDPLLINYNYHYPRVDQIKLRNTPDRYGNFIYIVKGTSAHDNPYKPNDIGSGEGIRGSKQYFNGVEIDEIEDEVNNDVLYEINIVDNNYQINNIYDRRIYIDARDNLNYNISLLPETLAYFPFKKDFNSTNGLTPLNFIQNSKIIPIIKNYSVVQLEEVGAWHDGYQLGLRTQFAYPGTSFSVFVDPISGSDDNDGKSENTAYKTVQKAVDNLYSNGTDDYVTNIIITSAVNITENIEIDKPFTVSIVAKTYCNWSGSIQNITKINLQGIWFKNTALYPYNEVNAYYCTFNNTSINCSSPQKISLWNSESSDNNNSLIRVKNILYPSPFTHPYKRVIERDDSIQGIPSSVATSDNESIAPGDSFINVVLQSSVYTFQNCLIYGSTDHIVEFDPEPNWSANFIFDFCTISDNAGLFATPKYDLIINYSNSILFNNRENIGDNSKIFNTNSSISFDTCFIDFPNYSDQDGDSSNWNYKIGELLGRESCIYSENIGGSPQFVGEDDYHLKSIAKGSTIDSPALEQGIGGLDLGCYAETREQTEQDIPKKLKNYTAYIDEALRYAMTINSEKITITMEFKPAGTVSNSGILFDTRTANDDLDYIVLAYNNNADDDHSISPNPLNSPEDPYRFRVIVANQEKSYSIISPVNIITDEEYQTWHRLSFTINYEKIINAKPKFDEYNKLQNIIIFYHNDQVSIESFVKYDLSRFTTGELIQGRGGEGTNSWDFNDITKYITIGAAFDNSLKMTGYYDELRIDNRFVDRKQFELWNVKKVQFNDPVSYVNEIPLTRSLDPRTLEEYWSLKEEHDKGSKKNHFLPETNKRITYEDGNKTWFLGNPTQNNIINSNFAGNHNALAETNSIDFDSTIIIESNWIANTIDSRIVTDNNGININVLDPSLQNYTADYGYQDLNLSIPQTSISSSAGIGANIFPYKITIDGIINEKNLILEAGSGYQEIDGGGITTTTITGLNVGNTETEYGLDYTLYPGTIAKHVNIKLEGQKEITNIVVSGGLSTIKNKYFEISSTHDDNRYYIWYAENNGGSPTLDSLDPAGQTNIGELTINLDYNQSYDWDGQGFTIYNNNNEPINIWFDVNIYNTDYGYTTISPPDFGNSGIYIPISLESSGLTITKEQLAIDISTALVGRGFDIDVTGNILTIGNTEKLVINSYEDHDDQSVVSFNLTQSGSSPTPGLNAFDQNDNLVKNGIMVLINSTDTQDEILDKTSVAFNINLTTDNIIDAEYQTGHIETSQLTFNSDDILDYDSKYFTLVSANEYGQNIWYYVWLDSGQSGRPQITEITCGADDSISTDPNLHLNDKYFVLSITDNEECCFWYNTGDGRDPALEHQAEQEIFTLAYEDTSTMRIKSGYVGKYFEFSALFNNYYLWYTDEGVGDDPAIPGKQSLKVDLGQLITGTDQRSQIIDATMDILRAQVVGFDFESVKRNDAGEGENIMKMFIPAGDVQDPTIGNFDQSDMTINLIQQGKDSKLQEYLGSGVSLEINITENEPENGVAAITNSVINNVSNLSSTVSGNIITVTNDISGLVDYPYFNNIITIHQAITTQVGIKPTTDPQQDTPELDGFIGIAVDISTATTRATVAAQVAPEINANSAFDVTRSNNVVTINTSDDTEHLTSPTIGNLETNVSLNITYLGNSPQIQFTNEVNGVVTTQPNSGNVSAIYELEQIGTDADTTYGSLIDELNIETLGDLEWSIIEGKLRATTIAQGIDSTVAIDSGSELIEALGDPTILPNQNGDLVDDKWSTVLQKLNINDSNIEWVFYDNGDSTFDIRVKSNKYGAGSSIMFSDTNSSLDLIEKIGGIHGSLKTPVNGFSRITINNQYDLEMVMKAAFKNIETRIGWAFRNDKLVFFTDDFMASSIIVDFGDTYSAINPNRTISGQRLIGSWDIPINEFSSLEDTISFNYLPQYNNFSENSMIVEKQSNDDPIDITQNIFLQKDTDYTFSALIYSDEYITSENLQFKLTNQEVNWTSIEKATGGWWKVIYTFNNDLPGNYIIGFTVKKVDRIYIDAVQLEAKSFASPYVGSNTNTIGKIGISKALMNKERGTLFFKFKPYFKYDTPTIENPIVIINLPIVDETNSVNQNLGLKVIYYFDPLKNRGIFEYKMNNQDSSSWKLEIPIDFFNQWHSIGFVYDFINYRFVYWLDYFNYIIDSKYTNYIWHDLWIGHDGVESKSADMAVKDIIIHNYTTTDAEIQNWNNAYEFFNESAINSSIEEILLQVQGVKQEGLDYLNLSEDLESKINMIDSKVDDYEINEDNNADALGKIKEFVEYPISLDQDYTNLPIGTGHHETRITSVESVTDSLYIKTDSLQNEINDIISGGSEGVTVTSNLIQLRNDIDNFMIELNTEKNDRGVEDQKIKDNLASTLINQGASLIGVNDANSRYSTTNIESILQEIAGDGRTTESLVSLKEDIETVGSTISSSVADIDYIKDGNSLPSKWTQILSQSSGYNIYDIKTELDITTNQVLLIRDNLSQASLFDSITMNNVALSTRIDNETSNREDAIIQLKDDLISNDNSFGAAMIGVEDPNSVFVYQTVEQVLLEISGIGRNSAMTISDNYNTIQSIVSNMTTLQDTVSNNFSNISDIDNDINMIKDGNDGTTWDILITKPNLVDHESKINDNESAIDSSNTVISNNAIQISNINSTINTISSDLTTEINNRANGDAYILQQLADDTNGKGASLIAIEDINGKYTSTTVEGALAEVDTKIAALAGALSWQSPVNDFASLPTIDNSTGDARTVFDDGDGHQAQYVWSGTVWVKIADIDWGDSLAIGYDNTNTEIPVTNVQEAIDFVYLNQKDKTKAEGIIISTDWVLGTGTYDGFYYANINHELGTEDTVCLIMDNGIVIGVEEIERIDKNNIRIYVVDNTLNLDVTVFGVVDKYSKIISQWTPDGTGSYFADIVHGFETQKLMISTFDIDTQIGIGWLTGSESIEFIDDNTIRVKTSDNTTVMNFFVLKKATDTITKDIQNWIWDTNKNAYIAAIQVDASYDAVFNFFDPLTGKTIGMDLVQLENGILTIAKSNNDIVRMIIIK